MNWTVRMLVFGYRVESMFEETKKMEKRVAKLRKDVDLRIEDGRI